MTHVGMCGLGLTHVFMHTMCLLATQVRTVGHVMTHVHPHLPGFHVLGDDSYAPSPAWFPCLG